MTKICCNYSNELIELLNEGLVDVDYIKVTLEEFFTEATDEAKKIKPLMVHYLGLQERSTMIDYKLIDFTSINEKLRDLKSPVTGLHAYIEKLDFESRDPSYDQALNRSIEVISHFKNNLEVPLLIENYPYSEYYDSLDNHHLTMNTKMFHDICEKCDVGMILDISHAKCSSAFKGISLKEYLKTFPLDRVVELHVNSTFNHPERGVIDRHLELEEDDYEVIEWLCKICNIEYLTLEYGGIGKVKKERSNKEAILRQLTRLKEILIKY